MAVWRLQVNTGGANVADYCLQNHVAALGGWQGTCYGAFIKAILHVSDELIEKIYIRLNGYTSGLCYSQKERRIDYHIS